MSLCFSINIYLCHISNEYWGKGVIQFRITDPFNCTTTSQIFFFFIIARFFPIQKPVYNPLIRIYTSNTIIPKTSSTALDNHILTGPSTKQLPISKTTLEK